MAERYSHLQPEELNFTKEWADSSGSEIDEGVNNKEIRSDRPNLQIEIQTAIDRPEENEFRDDKSKDFEAESVSIESNSQKIEERSTERPIKSPDFENQPIRSPSHQILPVSEEDILETIGPSISYADSTLLLPAPPTPPSFHRHSPSTQVPSPKPIMDTPRRISDLTSSPSESDQSSDGWIEEEPEGVPTEPDQDGLGPAVDLITHILNPQDIPSIPRCSQKLTFSVTFRGISNVLLPLQTRRISLRTTIIYGESKVGSYLDLSLSPSQSSSFILSKFNKILVHFPVSSPILLRFELIGDSKFVAATNLVLTDGKVADLGKKVLQFSQKPKKFTEIRPKGLFSKVREPSLSLSAEMVQGEKYSALPDFSVVVAHFAESICAFAEAIESTRKGSSNEHSEQLLSLFSSVYGDENLMSKLSKAMKEKEVELDEREALHSSLFSVVMDGSAKPFHTDEVRAFMRQSDPLRELLERSPIKV